jgi:hypothetical protein
VLERCFELFVAPAPGLLADLGDGQVAVTLGELPGSLLRLLACRLLRRRPLRAADRLDLDLRQLRAEAGVAAIARLRAVLPDPDLLAER